MPSSSFTINLEIEHDKDYHFLNALRMKCGFTVQHPAHISLVKRLHLVPDPYINVLTTLEKYLEEFAMNLSPFHFEYDEMDPLSYFGQGKGCVALTVLSPQLSNVIKDLETMFVCLKILFL